METTIYMEPVGKARPRHGISKKGKAFTYNVDKTAHAENLIRDKCMDVGARFEPSTPLRLTAFFFRSRPKKPKHKDYPITAPDCDNYLKLLQDALQKFIFDNDAEITTVIIGKRFAASGQPPRIEIKIEEEGGYIPFQALR